MSGKFVWGKQSMRVGSEYVMIRLGIGIPLSD
jgi:hypothetical protein